MDERRLADVRAGTGDKAVSSGSGYLIGPSLVLTARHILVKKCRQCEADTTSGVRTCPTCTWWSRIEVRIGHPIRGAQKKATGTVCWEDWNVDLALVRIDPFVTVLPLPVRWGFPVGDSYLDYEGMGYPRLAEHDDPSRNVEPLQGQFNPISHNPDGYALNQTNAPSANPANPLWKGVSGAPVFARELLFAVVAKDDRRFDARRLHAVPVWELIRDSESEFVKLIRRDTQIEPVVEPIELVDLLDARMESTTGGAWEHSDGQTELIGSLLEWRDSPLQFAVALVTGKGGQGKLGIGKKLAYSSRQAGWAVGSPRKMKQLLEIRDQARRAEEFAGRIQSSTAPVMIICDHSETNPVFLVCLASTLHRNSPVRSKVRLLLLSGSQGAWLDDLTVFPGVVASQFNSALPDDIGQTSEDLLAALQSKAIRISKTDSQITIQVIRSLDSGNE